MLKHSSKQDPLAGYIQQELLFAAINNRKNDIEAARDAQRKIHKTVATLIKTNRHKNALGLLTALFKTCPDFKDTTLYLATAKCARKRGYYDLALEYCDKTAGIKFDIEKFKLLFEYQTMQEAFSFLQEAFNQRAENAEIAAFQAAALFSQGKNQQTMEIIKPFLKTAEEKGMSAAHSNIFVAFEIAISGNYKTYDFQSKQQIANINNSASLLCKLSKVANSNQEDGITSNIYAEVANNFNMHRGL